MKTLEQLGISPAPWNVSGSGKTNGCIVDAEGIICASGAPHGYPSANARLIAAAPELYEALYDVVAYCESTHLVPSERFGKVLAKVKSALAKAGGEE